MQIENTKQEENWTHKQSSERDEKDAGPSPKLEKLDTQEEESWGWILRKRHIVRMQIVEGRKNFRRS